MCDVYIDGTLRIEKRNGGNQKDEDSDDVAHVRPTVADSGHLLYDLKIEHACNQLLNLTMWILDSEESTRVPRDIQGSRRDKMEGQ
jgi:hypothetical protein